MKIIMGDHNLIKYVIQTNNLTIDLNIIYYANLIYMN